MLRVTCTVTDCIPAIFVIRMDSGILSVHVSNCCHDCTRASSFIYMKRTIVDIRRKHPIASCIYAILQKRQFIYHTYTLLQAECLNTSTTLSPLKNILEINRSLLTGLPFFPLADLGVSVHISLTLINTILLCRSKALILASSLRLFRRLIRTWS